MLRYGNSTQLKLGETTYHHLLTTHGLQSVVFPATVATNKQKNTILVKTYVHIIWLLLQLINKGALSSRKMETL